MVNKRLNDLVDAGSEYSFPASDPPSYMGGIAIAGRPPHDQVGRGPGVREVSRATTNRSITERDDGGGLDDIGTS
jgi:hypothetical protein